MASTTKLMTAYLAREELRLDDVVAAAPYSPGPAESLMELKPNEQVSVHDLLYGLLLASGNDAAVALAVASAGSEDAFVKQMNQEAHRLGLDNTGYENPIGFDGPGHHTSVSDLAQLAIEIREDEFLREVVDTPSITLTEGEKPRQIVNRNNLVREYPFVDGVKTGYTDGAGYVLVGSATEKGVTLISALIGAPSEAARDAGTLELLRYGLSLYERKQALRAHERLAEVQIRDRDVVVDAQAERGLSLTLRRDQDVEVRATGVPFEVEGPVDRGERLGTAVVTVDGAPEARIPLVAARSAEAANTIERIDAALPGGRAAAWGLLALAVLAAATVLVALVAGLRRRRGGGR